MCIVKNLILIVYIDDVLIFSKNKVWINIFAKSFFEGAENFELTDKGSINKFLKVNIRKNTDGSYELK